MTDIVEKQIIHIKKEWVDRAIIAAGFILFILLVIAQLAWPYDRDQGIISVVADKILAGGVPYKDGWDVKGPLPYYIYALAQWGSNHEDWGIRVFDFVILSYGMAAVWYIAKNISNSFVSYISCFALGAWYFSHPYLGGQPDAWIGVLMTIMVALLFYDNGTLSTKISILSGVILALVFLIKPPYLLYSFLPFIYAIQNGQGRTKKSFLFVLKSALTCILIIYAALLWLWINDALLDFFDIVFVYTWETHRKYFEDIPGIYFYNLTLKYFIGKEIVITFILFFMGFAFLWQNERRKAILLGTWFLISCVLIGLQGTYFHYQLFLVLPVFAILTAYSLKIIKKIFGQFLLYFLCISILFLAYQNRMTSYIIPSIMLYAGKITSVSYYSQFQVITTRRSNFFLMLATEYLNKNNPDNKPIYILSFDPVLHYWSETAPPTRLSFIMPFAKSEGKTFNKYSNELIRDLNNNKPEYIIIFNNDLTIVQPKTSQEYSFKIKGFRELLDSYYKSDTRIEDMTFYKYHNDRVCYFDYPQDLTNNVIVDYWQFYKALQNINKKQK